MSNYVFIVHHRQYPLQAAVVLSKRELCSADNQFQLVVDKWVSNMRIMRSDYVALHELDNDVSNYQIEQSCIVFL